MIVHTIGLGKRLLKDRDILQIIIHCSCSDNPDHDDIDVIRKWHKNRRMKDVGYHFFIKANGDVQLGRPVEERGAHCIGHNGDSIGICVSGKTQFNDTQFQSLYSLVEMLMNTYNIKRSKVFPHTHYNPYKTCPNFALDQIWKFELPF